MDKERLFSDFTYNIIDDKLKTVSKPKEQRAIIDREAAKLAERDADIRNGFAEILTITGYEERNGYRIAPRIALGQVQDPELGLGILTANVRQANHRYSTFFYFEREGQEDAIVLLEDYNCGNAYDEGYAARAGKRARRDSLSYDGPGSVFKEDIEDDLPEMEAAESTQRMLWDALCDPELNPQFAEKAQALQQA